MTRKRRAMRGDDDRMISCERKERYSFAEARRIARCIRQQTDEPVAEYPCRNCGGWHVGEDQSHKLRKSYLRKGTS